MDTTALPSPGTARSAQGSHAEVLGLIEGLEAMRRRLDRMRAHLVARAVAGDRAAAEARSRAAHPSAARARPRLAAVPSA